MIKLREKLSAFSIAPSRKSPGETPDLAASKTSSSRISEKPCFHLFPKLPPELQLRIWESALLPQLIWLGSPEGKNRGSIGLGATEDEIPFIIKSSSTALLGTYHDSRQVALKRYGVDLLVSWCAQPDFDQNGNLARYGVPKILFSIKVDSSRDAIYLHRITEVLAFTNRHNISSELVTDPEPSEKICWHSTPSDWGFVSTHLHRRSTLAFQRC